MTIGNGLILCGVAALCFMGTAPAAAQNAPRPAAAAADQKPVNTVLDPGVITTRQATTPAGIQMVFQGRVYGAAFGSTSDIVYALSGTRGALVYKLDWRQPHGRTGPLHRNSGDAIQRLRQRVRDGCH